VRVYSEAFLPEAVAIDMLTSNRTFYEKKFKSINEDLLKEVPVEKVAKVKAEVITEEVVNEVFAEVAIEKVTKHIKKRKAK
jgi:hypothetical protein